MKLTADKTIMDRLHYWILGLIFALAILLRIVGIDWGMPQPNLHPDEGIIYNKAYECALERKFEIEDYYYRPNHVLIKLNTLVYIGMQDLYFEAKGQSDFEQNFSENIALFITVSRLLTAAFGVGVVVLAYLIAINWGRIPALFVSMLFAVFPSFIEHSHYITPDIPLLFFYMCVLYTAIQYNKKPSGVLLFLMSLFTALGTCEKFPGAYGCLIIAVAVIVTYYKKPLMIVREGILAILFFVGGIMAVSPILLVDYKDVLVAMAGQNAQYHLGADGLNFGETIWFYLKTTGEHVGLILTVSSIYGLYKSFKKNWKLTAILFTFFIYLIPISVLKVHWERYTLPLYAIFLFMGGFGLFYAYEKFRTIIEKRKIMQFAVLCVLFLLPLGSLFSTAIAMDAKFLAPDSRIYLQDIFAKANINKNNTSYDCNTPLDPGGYYGAFSNFEGWDPKHFKYGTIHFVMTSSSQRDAYFESDQEIYGGVSNFYRKLDEEHELIYLFTVENPSSHFLELQNMWYAARTVYRYAKGACTGYEIRLYSLNL